MPFDKLRANGANKPPRLHREIGLTVGDDRFAGVAILHDQVAGVAGQLYVRNRALCAGADGNHFGDITEMVGDRAIRLLAR